jgi:ElaB/YqjD/DUF883 family membrane-anchored ribosome-binding protein
MLQAVWEKTGEQLTGVLGDGAAVAKKAARRVGHAAEDLVEGTTHTIKRHPLAIVAAAVAVAFASGMLVGRSTNRH